jgi:hypothetical protein
MDGPCIVWLVMHHPLICVRDVCTLLSHFILLFPPQTQKTAFMSADLENVFFSVSYMCVHVKTKRKNPFSGNNHKTCHCLQNNFLCFHLQFLVHWIRILKAKIMLLLGGLRRPISLEVMMGTIGCTFITHDYCLGEETKLVERAKTW